MRIAPAIKLTPDQQSLLESQARSRSLPARLVERSHIVLLAARGKQDKEIAHTLHMTPQKVSRWRKRFLRWGLAGLEKDAPRPGRTPKIHARLIQQVVEMTTRQKPTHATHWSTRTMAKAAGVSCHNQNPKPFIWTARAGDILEKVKRARQALNKRQSA